MKRYSVSLFIPLAVIPFCFFLYTFRELSPGFFTSNIFLIFLSLALICFFILWLRSLYLLSVERRKRKEETEFFKSKEEEYITMIENADGVLYQCDRYGNFSFLSKKCLGLTGYSAEELKGLHFTSLITEDWRNNVQEFYFTQNKYAIPETTYRFPIISKDGSKKWVEQTVVLLHDGEHQKGYQAIVKDITDKKLSEDLLKEANRKLAVEKEQSNFRMQAILDHVPMIVYIKDLSGRFVMVNKGFHKAFNTSDKMVLGRQADEVHQYDKPGINYKATDEEVMRGLKPLEVEDLVLTCEGERNMLVTKFPLFDSNGKLFAIGGIDRDITERIQRRQLLIDARTRAERAEKMQEDFLANMSHEIRTPMNGIVCMTNMLLETELTKTQQEYTTIVKQSSDILLSLINDMLDLSKIKAGRMTVEKIDFNLEGVVSKIIGPFAIRGAQKGIKVYSRINEVLPVYVRGDEHKLLQVLNNLLSNAVKFTEEGEVVLNIIPHDAGEDKIRLDFILSDTGVGIATECQSSIFEAFVQEGADTVRRFGGTGLGLAITKKLVELQGGMIQVCSETGRGTTFRVSISYEKSAKNNVPVLVNETETIFLSLEGRKILVVEDNVINQKAIGHFLQKWGLQVTIANHGNEAFNLLSNGLDAELILMDLHMPEMDGFEAAKNIREKLKLNTPIMAMTASAIRNEQARCFEMGMNEYVTKPFATHDIMRLLQQYLNGTPKEIKTAI